MYRRSYVSKENDFLQKRHDLVKNPKGLHDDSLIGCCPSLHAASLMYLMYRGAAASHGRC